MKKSGLRYKLFPEWYNPELLFENFFAHENYSYWLDTSLPTRENRFSYMGATPDKIYSYTLKNSQVTIQSKGKIRYVKGDIFSVIDRFLTINHIGHTKLPFDFAGGLIGYFGYELKALTGAKQSYQSPYPDSLWYFIEIFIAFDHKNKKVYLVYPETKTKSALKLFKKVVSGLQKVKKMKTIHYPEKNISQPAITYPHSKKDYMTLVKTCKLFLAKGESYQVCLTNTISAAGNIDPFFLYKLLREKNPAPYGAFFKYKELTILSSSPEQFLQIDRRGKVQTKPIKGTTRRGETKQEDENLKKELRDSKKEWSENAMITDLLRNDLGKVCSFGTVRVDKTMKIESYSTVHQLVSTVSGKLKENTSLIDCVKACFPGGSMTGAPKIHSMEILDNLEKQARGIYSGSLGYLSLNHTLMLNIIIRTIVVHNNDMTIGTGGAILMDSKPENEYDEMLLKAKALLESIKAAVYTTHMHTVYLALGSNVGNKKEYINKAVIALGEHIENIEVAKIYETKPMYFENQDTFLNTVIKGQTILSPQELFDVIKNTENELGRKKRFQNGPREIDIDLLFFDNVVHTSTNLIIPHPRINEREFVLKPFADIDPNFIHPVLHKTIGKLLFDLQKEI